MVCSTGCQQPQVEASTRLPERTLHGQPWSIVTYPRHPVRMPKRPKSVWRHSRPVLSIPSPSRFKRLGHTLLLAGGALSFTAEDGAYMRQTGWMIVLADIARALDVGLGLTAERPIRRQLLYRFRLLPRYSYASAHRSTFGLGCNPLTEAIGSGVWNPPEGRAGFFSEDNYGDTVVFKGGQEVEDNRLSRILQVARNLSDEEWTKIYTAAYAVVERRKVTKGRRGYAPAAYRGKKYRFTMPDGYTYVGMFDNAVDTSSGVRWRFTFASPDSHTALIDPAKCVATDAAVSAYGPDIDDSPANRIGTNRRPLPLRGTFPF
ncbi:hypothetical protein NUW54_g7383 [Trametes sanguinea]|uniref:Uncharacterized protein n=1 Tax=Trametes sanguinea TaxID=158606 RepID=A0ACC1PNW8_9APHY|nr:hypothetical protein NUW54_g7383 [Trametes sanguinea]